MNMNVLDIDAGNTRLKWRLVDSVSGHTIDQGVQQNAAPASMVANLSARMVDNVGCCRLASVRDESFIFALGSLIEERWGIMPRQPRPESGVGGLLVDGVDPARLGVDRWLAMLGAHARYGGQNIMIVDSGTALTLDVVSAAGVFEGGLICPGLNTMLKAMADSADRLVLPERPNLQRGLTFSSLQAVQNGALTMALSLIEREYERYQGEIVVLLCGGDASLLAEHLTIPAQLFPELVFAGLEVALPMVALA